MLPVMFTCTHQNIYLAPGGVDGVSEGGRARAPSANWRMSPLMPTTPTASRVTSPAPSQLANRPTTPTAPPPSAPKTPPSQLANKPTNAHHASHVGVVWSGPPSNAPARGRPEASPRARHPLQLPLAPSPEGRTPPLRQLAPLAPHRGPEAPPLGASPRDWGTGDRLRGVVAWAPRRRDCLPRESPCQGPHRKIPRRHGTLHATQRSHSRGPSIPQPRTVGPGSLLHILTDHIWGGGIQKAVKLARNCCGGQFLYEGGPCTTKSPYKLGHF